MSRSRLSPATPAPVLQHCEAAWPEEACGALLHLPDGRVEHRPLRNAYDAHRARDPAAWPRSNRTAFLVAPGEWMALEADALARGATICLYHSHCEGPAELSADDRRFAAPGGAPLLQGLTLLIVSVRAARAGEVRLYTWPFAPCAGAP